PLRSFSRLLPLIVQIAEIGGCRLMPSQPHPDLDGHARVRNVCRNPMSDLMETARCDCRLLENTAPRLFERMDRKWLSLVVGRIADIGTATDPLSAAQQHFDLPGQ